VSTKIVMDTTGAGRRRNRSWPESLKREIVAASLAPGASVSVVARHYDVNANQVFSWRKRFGGGALTPSDPISPQMVPVIVTAEPRDDHGAAPTAMIEIDLGRHYRIRVGNGVDPHALRKILDVLERR